MSQLRRGTVSLSNSQQLVRGNYDVILSTDAGTFAGGETITWTGGAGIGIVVQWLAVSHRLIFYRTLGPAPIQGDVIAAAGSGASGSIGAMAASSVPNFLAELPGGGPVSFEVPTIGEIYTVISRTVDSFTLAGVYGGATDPQSSYLITRDFTARRSYLKPKPGDIDVAGAVGRALEQIDEDVAGIPKSALALAAGCTAVDVSLGTPPEIRRLANGHVHLYGAVKFGSPTLPAVIATLPTGYRSVGRRRWFVMLGTTANAGIIELAPVTGVLSVILGSGITTAVYLDGMAPFVAEV